VLKILFREKYKYSKKKFGETLMIITGVAADGCCHTTQLLISLPVATSCHEATVN